MAFGSQNGHSNGGSGSKNGTFFGSGSANQSGTGFPGIGNNNSETSTNPGNSTPGGFPPRNPFTGNPPTGTPPFGPPTGTPPTGTPPTGTPPFGPPPTGNPPTGTPPTGTTPPGNAPRPQVNNGTGRYIRGKISQYRTIDKSRGYRRLLPQKLYQAIVYGQRLEDFLHYFVVTETRGHDAAGNPIQQAYVVNVHGTINYGAALVDNDEVEVRGKFTSSNVMLARDVRVINGMISTPVRFQRSVKYTALAIVALVLVLLGVVDYLSAGSGSSISSFVNSLWDFLATMFAVFIFLMVLYVVFSFSRIGIMARLFSGGRGGSPLLSMLIASFVITLLLYNVFGLGFLAASALSGVFGAFGPIIIMIIGLVIMFKALK